MTDRSSTQRDSPSQAGGAARAWWIVVVSLAVLHFVLGLDCARRWSVTHDEYWHLPSGLAAWREGRFDVDNLNPPLTRIWDALPLAAGGAVLPQGLPADDAFVLGDRFLSANVERYDTWYLWARAFNLLLSVSTGVLLAVWGREAFGPAAGIVAAALWLLCPVVLSNGALVTPDSGAVLLFSATVYLFWRHARRPSTAWALWAGACLGLAQLTKFTSVLLLPAIPLVWIVLRWRAGLPKVEPKTLVTHCAISAVMTLMVWNAGYLFRGTMQPLSRYEFRSRQVQNLVKSIGPLAQVPVPLPADYLQGFDRQRSIMEGSHPVYLDGVWSLRGFPHYYLYAAAYKLPHATQIWVACGVLAMFHRRQRAAFRTNLVLLGLSLLLTMVASSIGMQLGLRYVLPVFPLMYLLAGQAAVPLVALGRRWGPWLVFVSILPLVAGLRYHPHHLAYFNEASGGMAQGRQHLADSNLDWGQDLRELREYLRSREIKQLGLAYFGMYPPSALGITYELPPSAAQVSAVGRPPAGWYAVSVNFVLGRPHTIRRPDDSIERTGYQEYGYFRRYRPVATIGGSIDIYHIEASARVPRATGRETIRPGAN